MARKTKTPTKPLYSQLAFAEANRLPNDKLLKQLEGGGIVNMNMEGDAWKNSEKKLVLSFSYDHMDESGSYVGASEYMATVTPSLVSGINVKVMGKHADIREYLEDTLFDRLTK